MRPQAHHASREEMDFGADPVPAEEQHREEARFEEEREDALRRQRAAEHIAHIARVGRPVRAELELQHDARRHADGERQREDPRPEPRHLVVERVAVLEPQPFHDHQHQPQPDAQRRIQVMEPARQRELNPGEQQHIHNLPSGIPSPPAPGQDPRRDRFFRDANRAIIPKPIDAANRCNQRHIAPKTLRKRYMWGSP